MLWNIFKHSTNVLISKVLKFDAQHIQWNKKYLAALNLAVYIVLGDI